jgi:hypothetical protein
MQRWTLPEVNEDTPASVREAWRSPPALAVGEPPPPAAGGRAVQLAMLAGVIGGIAACAAILLLT